MKFQDPYINFGFKFFKTVDTSLPAMKIVATFVLLAVFCEGLPPEPRNYQNSPAATILHEENHNSGLGTYHFLYETSDGASREERAEIKYAGTPNQTILVQGSYTYIGSDGAKYTVTYEADENGYRPSGPHINKP